MIRGFGVLGFWGLGVVPTRGVVAPVGRKELMAIRVRVVARAVLREPVRVRPGMLTVPAGTGRVVVLVGALVPVDRQHVGRVPRIFRRGGNDVPRIRCRAGVREARVIVDDLVQLQAECFTGQSGRAVVVAGRRIRQRRRRHDGEPPGEHRKRARDTNSHEPGPILRGTRHHRSSCATSVPVKRRHAPRGRGA